jgi:hypothetical protein
MVGQMARQWAEEWAIMMVLNSVGKTVERWVDQWDCAMVLLKVVQTVDMSVGKMEKQRALSSVGWMV